MKKSNSSSTVNFLLSLASLLLLDFAAAPRGEGGTYPDNTLGNYNFVNTHTPFSRPLPSPLPHREKNACLFCKRVCVGHRTSMDDLSASYNYISNIITILRLVLYGLNKKIISNLLGQVEIKRRKVKCSSGTSYHVCLLLTRVASL
jgi:hypothetical protein